LNIAFLLTPKNIPGPPSVSLSMSRTSIPFRWPPVWLFYFALFFPLFSPGMGNHFMPSRFSTPLFSAPSEPLRFPLEQSCVLFLCNLRLLTTITCRYIHLTAAGPSNRRSLHPGLSSLDSRQFKPSWLDLYSSDPRGISLKVRCLPQCKARMDCPVTFLSVPGQTQRRTTWATGLCLRVMSFAGPVFVVWFFGQLKPRASFILGFLATLSGPGFLLVDLPHVRAPFFCTSLQFVGHPASQYHSAFLFSFPRYFVSCFPCPPGNGPVARDEDLFLHVRPQRAFSNPLLIPQGLLLSLLRPTAGGLGAVSFGRGVFSFSSAFCYKLPHTWTLHQPLPRSIGLLCVDSSNWTAHLSEGRCSSCFFFAPPPLFFVPLRTKLIHRCCLRLSNLEFQELNHNTNLRFPWLSSPAAFFAFAR